MTFLEYAGRSSSKPIILIEIVVGSTTYRYSYNDITPVGSSYYYDGRLISAFDIGRSRDPLTWGKMEFSGGSLTLNNADGFFDTFHSTWFIGWYGATVRIRLGYYDLEFANYLLLWSGYVETVELSPESFQVSVMESRKKLDVDIKDSWVGENALTVVKDAIILAYPNVTYDTTYFDTTAWALAACAASVITVDMIEEQKATEVIDMICTSIFGIFFMTSDDRYSFKMLNPDATASTTILKADVMNVPSISYDPTEVVSSVRVFCDIDFDLTSGNYVTILEDTTREAYVFSTYNIYNSKEITTYLPSTTVASVYAKTFLDYTMDVHGMFDINVPMKYYTLEVGDVVNVELYREGNISYLGTVKCEIIAKRYKLEFPLITFRMRMCYDEA